MGRQAIDPPGQAKPDLWLIEQIGRRMGLDWSYDGDPALVYEEMRQAMHASIAGITWKRLELEGAVTYPCVSVDESGQSVVFTERFPTLDGRVKLVPTEYVGANEKTDQDYPWVLMTGRQLEHWHTGSMTRRASVLDAIEPVPTASLHPHEISRLGLSPGDWLRLESRRGSLECRVRADSGMPKQMVFMPFAYREAAANLLTNPALDPFGKIPEFKFCAVRISPMAA
jgi:formate dehydrogenase major subunit